MQPSLDLRTLLGLFCYYKCIESTTSYLALFTIVTIAIIVKIMLDLVCKAVTAVAGSCKLDMTCSYSVGKYCYTIEIEYFMQNNLCSLCTATVTHSIVVVSLKKPGLSIATISAIAK